MTVLQLTRKTVFASVTTLLMFGVFANSSMAEILDVEKDELKFGFIKLTDMAPLAVAYEKGYFEDEGLFVTLEPQANWKVCLLYTSPSPRDRQKSRMPSSA